MCRPVFFGYEVFGKISKTRINRVCERKSILSPSVEKTDRMKEGLVVNRKNFVAAIVLVSFMVSTVLCWAAENKEVLRDACKKHDEQFEYPEAIDTCSRAIKLDANYFDAYFWRGVAYVATRQYDRAIDDFTQVLSLNPKDVQALSNRGLVYRRLKQFDKAIADLNMAVEIDPTYAEGWLSRGTVFAQLDQWNDAMLDYTEGIRLSPQNYTAYHNRGIAYGQMGQKPEAINDFRTYLRLAPTGDLLRASVEHRIKTLEEEP